MKREYKKPTATFIDYAYDEQVVAESSKLDGLGDGFQINYCTWQSGSYSNPCTSVIAAADTDRCFDFNPWSLRGQ